MGSAGRLPAMIPSLLLALAPVAAPPPPVDPLTAEVETADADRFAALYRAADGRPDAARLQRDYLDRGSYGVGVFIPDRIRNAAHLAHVVAADPALYARAIGTCLPVVKAMTPELRATYLGLAGLFPDKPLPRIYVVVGADNSGGTAAPGAQVLGLEVLCRIAATPEGLRAVTRSFFAHETVHSLQRDVDIEKEGGMLLGSVLIEGAADFIATLVGGRQIDPDRATWSTPREAELWRQFQADLVATRGATWKTLVRGTPAGDAFYRWIGNAGSPPPGWPGEEGYWIGQRIWQRWYDRQRDKRVAIRRMLTLERLHEVLAAGALPAGVALR